jgi:predicted GNAT family N-acyltransferase
MAPADRSEGAARAYASRAFPGVEFTVAACDDASVRRVREIVYVDDQQRLRSSAEMADTFDRFDKASCYILAIEDGEPVGTVKVIGDSEAGLPCGDHVDIVALRANHQVAEIGHLLSVPAVRQRGIGMGLMRQALVHAVQSLGATHILADFFASAKDGGQLRPFYVEIGFSPVGEPFYDERFQGSPMSRVGVLDVPAAAAATRLAVGRRRELMEFFYGDYDDYSRRG